MTGTKEKYTYRRLLDEVEVLAGVLREEGVKKGDVVLMYCTAHPFLFFVAPIVHECLYSKHEQCL